MAKNLNLVMQQFYKTVLLPEVPTFLKKIQTIEDAVRADKWGREEAIKLMS